MWNRGGSARTPMQSVASLLISACLLTGCSNVVEWREEVKLSDGRTVVVTQKRRCEGGGELEGPYGQWASVWPTRDGSRCP